MTVETLKFQNRIPEANKFKCMTVIRTVVRIIFETIEPHLVAKHVFLHKIVILGKGQKHHMRKS